MDGKRTPAEEKQSYIDGYEADVLAWRSRLDELEGAGLGKDDVAWQQAKQGHENALRLLKKYAGSGQKTAEKRG